MDNFNTKQHWETIYQTKKLEELSWFQANPETSLDIIKQFNLPKTAKIIDVGGGDSFLVDHLLDQGYQHISVLDISATAIEKAKDRLGERAKSVNWIIADATDFNPNEKYDFWHDRAAFHFLTSQKDISKYLETAKQNISANGILVIGAFSDQGPTKCSGIEVKQYSESALTKAIEAYFEKINCIKVDHKTPFNTVQNFTFCSFRHLSK
jgi:2-polyprenyl-3-methyl-5-hydroxy-6-metoxy-1,4-benzoquinol methylase